MTVAVLLGAAINISAAPGIRIDHLGPANTLVRVDGDDNPRYLLLPVQESNGDARISVLKDGNPDRTINVRLAKTKVDYYVPFDLTPYKGHVMAMNIVMPKSRESVRDAREDACWNNFQLADTFDTTNREKYRPAYHHTPLYGWMNDPNGMFYKDGVWHLYYQCNPYGSKWQNMTWGHSTSTDLVHWEHHPLAIEPNGLGAVFSGSCAIDPTDPNKIWAMYTSADVSQIQSLAWSTDGGETFTIYGNNPVLTLDSEARDPNMFWDAENNRWVLTLAHALEHEMLIFTSPDLKQWSLQSSFGKGIGAQGGVWECPDLFKLATPEGTEKWVLLCNINPGGPFGGSATQYFIGDFDGKTFTADTDADGHVPTKWMDFGKDHYATVSWSDAPVGRRTVIGWMSNWQYAAKVPTQQYRSANTLPRDVSLFRAPDGQLYLASAPSPELTAMRDKAVKRSSFAVGSKPASYSLPQICEITMDIDAAKAKTVDMVFSNKTGEKVIITYNVGDHSLSFDRRQSGIVDFNQDFASVTTSPTFENSGKVSLRIFIDRSSMEVFEKDGRFAMTNLVFPTQPYSQLTVSADGGRAKISNMTIYSIK